MPGSSRSSPAKQKSASPSKTPTPSSRRTQTPKSRSARKSTNPRRRSNAPSTSRQATSRTRRYRPRKHALKEIQLQQRSTKLCIRKLPFSRLVREIQHRQNPRITHWQVDAIAALQEAAEAYIVRFLEDCNEAAIFANRVTVMQKDFQFINKLRGRMAK